MYEVGNFEFEAIIPVPGVLTLLARLNIQSRQENLKTHLEVINQATGAEWNLDETTLEAVYKASPENSKNRIGDMFLNEAIGYLANNFKQRCADDMVKEALNEAVPNHQILFVPETNPKAPKYWDVKFQNGNFVIYFKVPYTNVYELGNFDFEALL